MLARYSRARAAGLCQQGVLEDDGAARVARSAQKNATVLPEGKLINAGSMVKWDQGRGDPLTSRFGCIALMGWAPPPHIAKVLAHPYTSTSGQRCPTHL